MSKANGIFEIVFHARGGQGAKTAAEILAQAAVSEGKFVQSFPSFGPERSGAPTRTYVRISEKPIRTKEPVQKPDLIAILDATLLDSDLELGNSDPETKLIINSSGEIKPDFPGEVFFVDADKISREIIGQIRPNTVILGTIVKLSCIISLESVISEFRRIFEKKIEKEAVEKNILAIRKAGE